MRAGRRYGCRQAARSRFTPFHATVGVTIRAVQPGSVQVTVGLTGSSVQCPGQTMRLVDLAMTFLNIADCTCALDGCSVTDAYGIHGACVSTQHATVVLNGCDLIGANPSQIIFGSYAGLAATASRISAVDCTFRGRPGDLFAYSGGQPGTTCGRAARCTGRG